MEEKPICYYNKYGYCKFTGKCFKRHEDKICERENCEISHCEYRHPKLCRYYKENNYCKFGNYCKYLHKEKNCDEYSVQNQSEDNQRLLTEIEKFKRDVEEKSNLVRSLEKELSDMNEKLECLRKENDKQSEEMKELYNDICDRD